VAWTIPSPSTCNRGDWRVSRCSSQRLSPYWISLYRGMARCDSTELRRIASLQPIIARVVVTIITSLPSVLPFGVSLQLQEGSTDMSQLNCSRNYFLATQCCLRFEPSSRTTLIGEQPNPWDLLQPQDVMSRHRGAKLLRRCGLLGGISLLSPEYLLSVERWPFHTEPPDHYDLLSHLLDLSVSQSSTLMPLHSNAR
jgi:hypothetical protein